MAAHKHNSSHGSLRPQSGKPGKPGPVPKSSPKRVQDTGVFKNPNAGIRMQKRKG